MEMDHRLRKGCIPFGSKVLPSKMGSNLDAQMILYGKVFGAAGTDNLRRDLKVGLLWGLPVALSVGIIGALATTILSVIIAAIAAWFEGWVNGLIQRVSEISMIIPTFRPGAHNFLYGFEQHLGDLRSHYPAHDFWKRGKDILCRFPISTPIFLHRICQGVWSKRLADYLALYGASPSYPW